MPLKVNTMNEFNREFYIYKSILYNLYILNQDSEDKIAETVSDMMAGVSFWDIQKSIKQLLGAGIIRGSKGTLLICSNLEDFVKSLLKENRSADVFVDTITNLYDTRKTAEKNRIRDRTSRFLGIIAIVSAFPVLVEVFSTFVTQSLFFSMLISMLTTVCLIVILFVVIKTYEQDVDLSMLTERKSETYALADASGLKDSAIAQLESIVRKEKNNPRLAMFQFRLGELYREKGDAQKSKEIYQSIIESFPADTYEVIQSKIKLIDFEYVECHITKALEMCQNLRDDEFVRTNPSNLYHVSRTMGQCNAAVKDYKEAMNHFVESASFATYLSEPDLIYQAYNSQILAYVLLLIDQKTRNNSSDPFTKDETNIKQEALACLARAEQLQNQLAKKGLSSLLSNVEIGKTNVLSAFLDGDSNRIEIAIANVYFKEYKTGVAIANYFMGEIYFASQKFGLAINCFQTAIIRFKERQSYAWYRINCHYRIIQILNAKQNLEAVSPSGERLGLGNSDKFSVDNLDYFDLRQFPEFRTEYKYILQNLTGLEIVEISNLRSTNSANYILSLENKKVLLRNEKLSVGKFFSRTCDEFRLLKYLESQPEFPGPMTVWPNDEVSDSLEEVSLYVLTFENGNTIDEIYPMFERVSDQLVENVASTIARVHSLALNFLPRNLFLDNVSESDVQHFYSSLYQSTYAIIKKYADRYRNILGNFGFPSRISSILPNEKDVIENQRVVLTHADLSRKNIIIHNQKISLIDWKHSRIAPASYDIAVHFTKFFYDDRQEEKWLDCYGSIIGRNTSDLLFEQILPFRKIETIKAAVLDLEKLILVIQSGVETEIEIASTKYVRKINAALDFLKIDSHFKDRLEILELISNSESFPLSFLEYEGS
jgi:thiamine kinase-like enzyme